MLRTSGQVMNTGYAWRCCAKLKYAKGMLGYQKKNKQAYLRARNVLYINLHFNNVQ